MNTIELNFDRKKIFQKVREYYTYTSYSKMCKCIKAEVPYSCTHKRASEIIKEALERVTNSDFYQKSALELRKENFKEICAKKFAGFSSTLPCSNYSMGEFKTITNKFVSNLFGEVVNLSHSDYTQEYAKSCKYSPTWGDVWCEIPLSVVKNAFMSGGVLTILGRKITTTIHRCKVVVYDYKKYRGKIGECTYHLEDCFFCKYKGQEFHAETLEEARKKIQAWKVAEKNIILQNKALASIVRNFLKKVFTYKDSIAAGNCVAGTNAFCQRHGLNHNSTMTGKELWKIAEKDSAGSYARRMLVDAIYRLTSVSKDKIKEYIDFKVYKK